MDISKVCSIELNTNNKDTITITKESFSNLFIGNINNNGELDNSDLRTNIVNCFILKILNDKNDSTISIMKRLLNKKDLVSIKLELLDKTTVFFELVKKRILENGIVENRFNTIFSDENNDLCILVTNKKIKYIEGLFI